MKTKRQHTQWGRPRFINPSGETRTISVVISAPLHDRLIQQANKRGVSVSQIIRERLQ